MTRRDFHQYNHDRIARINSRLWESVSKAVRTPACGAMKFSVRNEIMYRNTTRLRIWNRIPRSS